MLSAVLGGYAVRQVVQIADTYARLDAQLGTVSASAEGVRANMERLTAMSQRTGTAVADSVRDFQLLRGATLDLGVADERLIDLLGRVRENLEANGLSAGEAANFIQRLAAGLEGGRFRLEALRSLLIQMPQLLEALKQRFGVTTNQLFVMAAQGRLTGGVIFNALEQMKESKGPETVENAVGRLRNSFERLIATLDRLTGARRRVADFFDYVSTVAGDASDVVDATAAARRRFEETGGTSTFGIGLARRNRYGESLAELTRRERQRQQADRFGYGTEFSMAPDPRAPVPEGTTDPAALARAAELMRETNAGLARENELLRLNSDEREVINRQRGIEEKFQRNKTPLDDAEKERLEGTIRALQALKQQMQVVEDATKTVFKGMEDSIVSFVQTGKFEFNRFADAVVADLVRIALQAYVTRALTNAVTGFFGGALGGGAPGGATPVAASPGLGFATGGGFTVGGNGGPDSSLVAFRATPGERVSVSQSGAGGGGAPVINIINNTSEKTEARQERGASGVSVTTIIIGTVGKAMSDGKFDGSMVSRYGTRVVGKRR